MALGPLATGRSSGFWKARLLRIPDRRQPQLVWTTIAAGTAGPCGNGALHPCDGPFAASGMDDALPMLHRSGGRSLLGRSAQAATRANVTLLRLVALEPRAPV